MAFHYSPKIITDSLVLCLDAANNKSYPQSGTTWFDLSRGNNATFSSLTFSTTNNGFFEFNINDYCIIPYNEDFNLSNTDYTLDGWFNLNTISLNNAQVIISNDTSVSSFDWALIVDGYSIGIYSVGTSANFFISVSGSPGFPLLESGRWYNFTITSISGIISIYLDAVFLGSSAMATSNDSQAFITVGCAGWNNPNSFLNGKLSSVKVYRKGLISQEVLQNYNAVKSRFGF